IHRGWATVRSGDVAAGAGAVGGGVLVFRGAGAPPHVPYFLSGLGGGPPRAARPTPGPPARRRARPPPARARRPLHPAAPSARPGGRPRRGDLLPPRARGVALPERAGPRAPRRDEPRASPRAPRPAGGRARPRRAALPRLPRGPRDRGPRARTGLPRRAGTALTRLAARRTGDIDAGRDRRPQHGTTVFARGAGGDRP